VILFIPNDRILTPGRRELEFSLDSEHTFTSCHDTITHAIKRYNVVCIVVSKHQAQQHQCT